nr:PREDICTED: cytochrome P450 4C1-like [Bemisia tabaci]
MEKIPGPPLDSYFLGHSSEVFRTVETRPASNLQLHKEYGGIYRQWPGWVPFILLAKAEYAEVFFTSKNLETKSFLYDVFHDWLGQGLLTSSGHLWQQRRKLITPAFHFSVLNGLCDTLVEKGIKTVELLRSQPTDSPVDVYEFMYLVALDSICEAAMGIKINAMTDPKLDYIRALTDNTKISIERTFKPWLNHRFFYITPMGRRLARNLETIFQLSKMAINHSKMTRKPKRKENEDTEFDEIKGKKKLAFLDLLLEAHDSTTAFITDEGLQDEVNTFMFAGHETTASSMSFTLHILSIHPEIQEKCFRELDDIFQGSDRKPTVDDLRDMKYLEQVIKESLRLFPSAPQIGRRVSADTQFGKYIAPAGSNLTLSIYALHRDPEQFPDPEKFDPERFSRENASIRHPFAYVPFAAGARNCLGQKFAMMEEKVILSYIIRHFIIEAVTQKDDVKVLFSAILRSKESINVIFKQRNDLNPQ